MVALLYNGGYPIGHSKDSWCISTLSPPMTEFQVNGLHVLQIMFYDSLTALNYPTTNLCTLGMMRQRGFCYYQLFTFRQPIKNDDQ